MTVYRNKNGTVLQPQSRFCYCHVTLSKTTHDRLKDNPEEWYLYHTLYREARKTWEEIPFEKIAKALKKCPDWVVGDFGCGEAILAEILPNKVFHSTMLPSTRKLLRMI